MRFRIADNSAFSHIAASDLKLRLDQDDRLAEPRSRRQNRAQQQCRRDKRNIHHQERRLWESGFGQSPRGKEACIRTLYQGGMAGR